MNSFRKFAFLTTIATYFLIFVGGLVRVTGAGLGCPDWPTCFGRWIPPTSINQVPIEMQDSFNLTLAWIEYCNRLTGMLIGILILITAILAFKHHRSQPKILWPSLAAAFFVALEGWQGSVVVGSGLEPIIVTVHMVLALIIVSLLIYATQQAYYVEFPQAGAKTVFPPKTKMMLGLLWGLAIIQVMLGTQIRSALEVLAAQFPLLSDVEWLAKVGALNHIHMTVGVILAVASWKIGFTILKKSEKLDRFVRQATIGIIAFVTLQAIIGLCFVFFGMPQMAQLFHLWVATLYIGALLIVFSAWRKVERMSEQ